MAFYSMASNASLWRGIDYYKSNHVLSFTQIDHDHISGKVKGSEDHVYDVTIDLSHPKRSTCTCPFKEGRQVVCKHMVALYFTSDDSAYERFEEELRQEEIADEREEELWRAQTLRDITQQVKALSAAEAKKRLIDILYQEQLDYRNRRSSGYWW